MKVPADNDQFHFNYANGHIQRDVEYMRCCMMSTYSVEKVHLIAIRAMVDRPLELGCHPDLGLEQDDKATSQHAHLTDCCDD